MNKLVTLTRKDQDFEKYLSGDFSTTQIAIPLKSLNVNSQFETVTFQILEKSSIQKPDLVQFILETYRFRKFLFVLFPMFLVLVKNYADNSIRDQFGLVLGTVGILTAYVSAILRNDYSDHMQGIDRINPRQASSALMKGWVTAKQLKKWSNAFLYFALICGMPLMIAYPMIAFVLSLALVLGIWAQYQEQKSFKHHIGGELILFLLLGPLLTLGYQLSMGGVYDKEVVIIGFLWGWLMMFMHQLTMLSDIVVYSQAGFKNTVTWLGFDRGKRVISFFWALFVALYFLYHVFFAGYYWGWYFSTVLILISPKLILKFKSVTSPIGSDILDLYRRGQFFFLFTILVWTIENLWYLGNWKIF